MRALVLLCCLLQLGLAHADEPTLTITVGNDTRSFTRRELLMRPEATTIEVARDVTYRVPMTYRAVPVASLLAGITLPRDSVIEAVALNGFLAHSRRSSYSTRTRGRLSPGWQSTCRPPLAAYST